MVMFSASVNGATAGAARWGCSQEMSSAMYSLSAKSALLCRVNFGTPEHD